MDDYRLLITHYCGAQASNQQACDFCQGPADRANFAFNCIDQTLQTGLCLATPGLQLTSLFGG